MRPSERSLLIDRPRIAVSRPPERQKLHGPPMFVRGARRQRSVCFLVGGRRSAGCLVVAAGGSVFALDRPREPGVNRFSLVRAHNHRMNPTAQQLRCWVPAPLRVAAAGYAGRSALSLSLNEE